MSRFDDRTPCPRDIYLGKMGDSSQVCAGLLHYSLNNGIHPNTAHISEYPDNAMSRISRIDEPIAAIRYEREFKLGKIRHRLLLYCR
jgi:hypothetical protein